MTTLHVEGVSKQFNRRPIFRDVTFSSSDGSVLGITGRNGSGKSTLLKIIAGLLTPTSGKVVWTMDGKRVDGDSLHEYVGYAAPYLNLFEEFSAHENLKHFASIRGMTLTKNEMDALLLRVDLPLDRSDPIRSYSSGMKQRLKLVFAIMHDPAILMLDEPTSNLDVEGDAIVWSIIEEWGRNRIVLLASNEQSELAYCTTAYQVGAV